MAQRSTRSKSKQKVRKRPELRTSGGRRAKAARSEARRARAERVADKGPAIKVRPAGARGMIVAMLLAWTLVAAIVAASWKLDRWDTMGYPDSLWLFAAIGACAVSVGVGRIARSAADADSWGLQALLVPGVLLAAEAMFGPACPVTGTCATVGARGSIGLASSVLLVAALAGVTWRLARWSLRRAERTRPHQGMVRHRIAAMTMITAAMFPGMLIATPLVVGDVLLRDAPARAAAASTEVERACFGLLGAPGLIARPSPTGPYSDWSTFAVRRVGEDRPGIGKQGLPDPWVRARSVHPYEAIVSFNTTGNAVVVSCRRVGPDSGNATKDDLKQPEPGSNPISPKTLGSEFLPRFFTQGAAGPTEEGRKKAAADSRLAQAKAAKAKSAKAAKKKAAKKKKTDSDEG